MNVRSSLLRSIPAALAAVVFATGATSSSAAQNMDSTYAKYYEAIRAYELCNDVTFDQPTYLALTRAINEKTGADLSVGESLSTIDAAKARAWDMVFKQRCDSQPVRELLALFESDLAPAIR